MQETQSCTGAHFAFRLPEFELEPHAFPADWFIEDMQEIVSLLMEFHRVI